MIVARNNGITEGFPNKMELIHRQAYGFRNFENYRLRVYVGSEVGLGNAPRCWRRAEVFVCRHARAAP